MDLKEFIEKATQVESKAFLIEEVDGEYSNVLPKVYLRFTDLLATYTTTDYLYFLEGRNIGTEETIENHKIYFVKKPITEEYLKLTAQKEELERQMYSSLENDVYTKAFRTLNGLFRERLLDELDSTKGELANLIDGYPEFYVTVADIVTN